MPTLLSTGGLLAMPYELRKKIDTWSETPAADSSFLRRDPRARADSPLEFAAIPAYKEDLQAGVLTHDGDSGLECIVGFQDLSDVDKKDLQSITGCEPSEICFQRREYLADGTYITPKTPDLLMRREIQALSGFMCTDRLSKRVVGLTHTLSRLLEAYRVLRSQIQAKDLDAVKELAAAKAEIDRLHLEWDYMCRYWGNELRSLTKHCTRTEDLLVEEVRGQSDEHRKEVRALEARIQDLESKLQASESECLALQDQVTSGSLNKVGAWSFTKFMRTKTHITGHWKRLHDLFEHFLQGTDVPAAWMTQVMIMSEDSSNQVPFPSKKEIDQLIAAAQAPVIDLTKQAASSQRKSSKARATAPSTGGEGQRKKSPVKLRSVRKLQTRPTDYRPSRDPARELARPYERIYVDAAKALPKGMVWTDVRADVQVLMRMNLEYKMAFELVAEDRVLHKLFHRSDLLAMLCSMLYFKGLDETPWAKYVPVRYYEEAYKQLQEDVEISKFKPAAWDKIPPEFQEFIESSESEEDDEDEDPSYTGGKHDQGPESKRSAPEGGSLSDEADEDQDPGQSQASNNQGTHGFNEDAEDEEEVKPPASKSARIAPSDSGEDTDSVGHPSPNQKGLSKRLSFNGAQSSSAQSASSGKKRLGSMLTSPKFSKQPKVQYPSPRRVAASTKKSPLVQIPYKQLSNEQLETIEVPGAGCSSWCHLGIPLRRNSLELLQSPGFPDYLPQKSFTRYLKPRWNHAEYRLVVDLEPWNVMFNNRVKVLHFHVFKDLTSPVQSWVMDYVRMMHMHAVAFWESTHWLVLGANGDSHAALLQAERKNRRTLLQAAYNNLAKRSGTIKDFPLALWDEPSLWTFPRFCCHWILREPKVAQVPMLYQLQVLDAEDHARTQWAHCPDDEEMFSHFAPELRALIKDPSTPHRRLPNQAYEDQIPHDAVAED